MNGQCSFEPFILSIFHLIHLLLLSAKINEITATVKFACSCLMYIFFHEYNLHVATLPKETCLARTWGTLIFLIERYGNMEQIIFHYIIYMYMD